MALMVDEMATFTETVDPDVAAAFAKYSVDGDPIAQMRLILRAMWADQPLCGAPQCWTPHGLDFRSCCGQFICDNDAEEHDDTCGPFLAIRREDTF